MSVEKSKMNRKPKTADPNEAEKSNVLKESQNTKKAAKKLPFENFTNEFKDNNRKRENEYRFLRRKVKTMEEEIENVEECLEALNGQKMKLKAEQNDAITIERQSKRAMERYRKVILSSTQLKKILKINENSDVASIIFALKNAQKESDKKEQIKKFVSELKFN
uniref:Uncharacterized protein n=1 Tax=Panagrolaimus davidi TaxID=227884 RepID=A0A914QX88_9BILA